MPPQRAPILSAAPSPVSARLPEASRRRRLGGVGRDEEAAARRVRVGRPVTMAGLGSLEKGWVASEWRVHTCVNGREWARLQPCVAPAPGSRCAAEC
eukprot:353516-Chlamydomonas_euryale.AAC.2